MPHSDMNCRLDNTSSLLPPVQVQLRQIYSVVPPTLMGQLSGFLSFSFQ